MSCSFWSDPPPTVLAESILACVTLVLPVTLRSASVVRRPPVFLEAEKSVRRGQGYSHPISRKFSPGVADHTTRRLPLPLSQTTAYKRAYQYALHVSSASWRPRRTACNASEVAQDS